jgi:hypothetical protein
MAYLSAGACAFLLISICGVVLWGEHVTRPERPAPCLREQLAVVSTESELNVTRFECMSLMMQSRDKEFLMFDQVFALTMHDGQR